MTSGVKRDHSRFQEIIKGRIRKNLRKYITHGEMLGKKGEDLISIPVPAIDLPRFKFGSRQKGGVGQGDGDPGDPIGGQQDDQQAGEGQAGSEEGQHVLEADITVAELAEMLGQELELPRIQPRGNHRVSAKKFRYNNVARVGPDGLRHFKRTFREALKREISTGTYNPDKPSITPIQRDLRYLSWTETVKPENNAVVIYMMDVSGSMGDEQKEIVRIESFWIDTWLRSQYKGIETRFIIHDATAKEVDQDTFFRTRESGGTLISSAYKLCIKIINEDYPQDQWNVYPFHFSDGDNWSGEDTKLCMDILQGNILPHCNVFCYGQVDSRYGSGQFLKDLEESFKGDERIITSRIENKDAIYKSIKDFLGKGK
jgi:sporulation protein YhbH